MRKTTFLRALCENDALVISYKPQKIVPKFTGTVKQLLMAKINSAMASSQFMSDIIIPLNIKELYDYTMDILSGGQLQLVAIVLCLGKPADVYLLDEPSAYLDSEQRIIVAKIIKRFVLHNKKTAFVVEHDFMMSTYLADKVIVFEGIPAIKSTALEPMSLQDGMNYFLKSMNITMRCDTSTHRPRINKLDSLLHCEQTASVNLFM